MSPPGSPPSPTGTQNLNYLCELVTKPIWDVNSPMPLSSPPSSPNSSPTSPGSSPAPCTPMSSPGSSPVPSGQPLGGWDTNPAPCTPMPSPGSSPAPSGQSMDGWDTNPEPCTPMPSPGSSWQPSGQASSPYEQDDDGGIYIENKGSLMDMIAQFYDVCVHQSDLMYEIKKQRHGYAEIYAHLDEKIELHRHKMDTAKSASKVEWRKKMFEKSC